MAYINILHSGSKDILLIVSIDFKLYGDLRSFFLIKNNKVGLFLSAKKTKTSRLVDRIWGVLSKVCILVPKKWNITLQMIFKFGTDDFKIPIIRFYTEHRFANFHAGSVHIHRHTITKKISSILIQSTLTKIMFGRCFSTPIPRKWKYLIPLHIKKMFDSNFSKIFPFYLFYSAFFKLKFSFNSDGVKRKHLSQWSII